jgi:predicted amidophosphoribosyltransferase
MVSEHHPNLPPSACPGCLAGEAHSHQFEPAPNAAACPLCAAPLPEHAPRCPSCGSHLVSATPPRFSGRAIGGFIALFLACYAIALSVVAAAR